VRPVRFLRAAQAEYRAALAWYAARSLDVADDFAAKVAAAVHEIRELPEAWPMWLGRPGLRGRVLRRFPYTIIYVVRAQRVVILAVAHQRRRPGYWLSRRR
jgi:plasmid stabilization system protein ParE